MHFFSRAIVTWHRIYWPFSGFYLWGHEGRRQPVGNGMEAAYQEMLQPLLLSGPPKAARSPEKDFLHQRRQG